MHARQTIGLDQELHIIRDAIARVQTPILPGPVGHFQQSKHLILIYPHGPGKFCQSLVGLVPGLIHDAHIEVILLHLEQCIAEWPELIGRELEHGDACFVYESGGGMPGLDLLAEDDLECLGILGFDHGQDGVEESEEAFGGKGTDVVED